jgi:RNA polymerase sigma-70 factor (ECF subfamily)
MIPSSKAYNDSRLQEAQYHLIAKLNRRDERAFYIVFHQLYPAIVSFANKLVQDINLAQEICSDSFIKLYQSEEIFARLENVKAYLFTITKNECYNALKKIKYQTQVQKQLQLMLESDDRNFIIKQEIQSELIELIYSSIEKLPSQCRRVFQMNIQGMSYEEIADALKVSVSTVRNQKARGLKLLKIAILKEGNLPLSVTISILLDFFCSK